MTVSVRRRTSFSRPLLVLGGIALLALLAVAALLFGGALGERGEASAPEVQRAATTAAGEPDHSTVAVHAFRQQPSTRARSAAFALLVAATVIATWTLARRGLTRDGRLHTLHLVGLPPGRGPPAPRTV